MVIGLGLQSTIPHPTTSVEFAYQTDVSWSFDGTNDNINLGNNASLKPTEQITVASWIKHEDWQQTGTSDYIISNVQYPGGWRLSYDNTKVSCLVRVDNAGKQLVSGWRTFALGSGAGDGSGYGATHYRESGWHHVGFTFDGRYLKLYIDGGLAGSGTNTLDLGSSGNLMEYADAGTNADVDTMIGADPNVGDGSSGSSPGSTGHFSGYINECAVWSSALTADAFEEIFNHVVVSPGYTLDLKKDWGNYTYSENLVGLWRADPVVGAGAGALEDLSQNTNNGTLINGVGHVLPSDDANNVPA